MENKILAIKGHSTRYKEVIEVLEMLGGKNTILVGKDVQCFYYIDTNNNFMRLGHTNYCNPKDFIIFTLEEFLEKYPYKVGDKVKPKEFTHHDPIYTIERMVWENGHINYIVSSNGFKMKVTAEDLQPYKEEVKVEDYSEIYADHAIDNDSKTDIIINGEKLIAPKGYTILMATRNSNKLIVEYVKNKSQYPKTFKECCDLLETDRTSILRPGYKYKQFIEFQELLICRDAYWKIAGEEMGLFEPWKPSANDEGKTHALYYNRCTDSLDKCEGLFESNAILDFPTKEMRDAFYENFKDLIESCKEFL